MLNLALSLLVPRECTGMDSLEMHTEGVSGRRSWQIQGEQQVKVQHPQKRPQRRQCYYAEEHLQNIRMLQIHGLRKG